MHVIVYIQNDFRINAVFKPFGENLRIYYTALGLATTKIKSDKNIIRSMHVTTVKNGKRYITILSKLHTGSDRNRKDN